MDILSNQEVSQMLALVFITTTVCAFTNCIMLIYCENWVKKIFKKINSIKERKDDNQL